MRQLWGIDGGQGSGKTTYAKQLLKRLEDEGSSAIYIETDDFLSERSFRNTLQPDFFNNIDNLELLFDFKRMGKTLTEMLDTDRDSLTLNGLYNSANGSCDLSKTFKLSEDTIVIVGGPYLLQATWPAFSKKVFLDAPESVRLQRTLRRNQHKARSDASQRMLFANFEKFYSAYWGSKLGEYDEIISNFAL